MPISLKVTPESNTFDCELLGTEFIESINFSMWSDDELRKLVDKLIREHKS